MTTNFTTSFYTVLQSPYPFPSYSLYPARLKSIPIPSFTVKFRTPTSSKPFKYQSSAIGISGSRKGRIKTRSELNAVDGDKGTVNPTDDKARAALEQLDSQLSEFAEKKVAKDRNTEYLESNQEKAFKKAGIEKVEWPEFSPGFLAFAGIGLLLLTVLNNVLYSIFVGPPVRKRTPPPSISDSTRPQFGYKVESPEAPALANKS